ncbi:hypothetical protein A7J58_12355 [Enterobacter cloacae]|nr:hypothetical protein A7J56_12340 [Enterobacter cloacae]OAE71821.1 hypothetical protein A7J58_12355 [Enterobacter cloacae]OAZ46038.1 hypothetical protein A9Z41_00440 [Enterobacter cloacae]
MWNGPLDWIIEIAPQIAAKEWSVWIAAAWCAQNDMYRLMNIVQPADIFFRALQGRLPVQSCGSCFSVHGGYFPPNLMRTIRN